MVLMSLVVSLIVTESPVQVVTAVLDIQMLEEDPVEGAPELTVMNAVDNWI